MLIEDFLNNIDNYKKELDYNEYVELVKTEAVEVVNTEFSKALDLITKKYPEQERLTWPQQKAEALAYTKDSTTNTPLLDNISKARGIDKKTLAEKILAKAAAYETVSGLAVGYRQKAEDALNAINTVDDLNKTIEQLRGYKNIFYQILNSK